MDTDREWLQQAIGYLGRLPATRALVDAHSALRLVSPSGDAVTRLLEFWRRRGEDGALVHDLADPSLSTRFLGDLYQDLSQHAKDTYALLQTPVFVEEFILDQTLEPALEGTPPRRLQAHRPDLRLGPLPARRLRPPAGPLAPPRPRPGTPGPRPGGPRRHPRRRPQPVRGRHRPLPPHGRRAPGIGPHVAGGSPGLHLPPGGRRLPHPRPRPGRPARHGRPHAPTCRSPTPTEDGPLLLTLLEEGRYDVVVGNPPYITVKDKALNQIYRSKYANVCKGTYALTVPFMAQFFALAKGGDQAGWVGQITSNSFMKREFGTKLIEDFLATRTCASSRTPRVPTSPATARRR